MKNIKKIFRYRLTNWETGEFKEGVTKPMTFEQFLPIILRMFNDFKDSKDDVDIELHSQYIWTYKEGDLF